MTIKAMFAFDHVPVGSSTTGGYVPGYYVDFPFTYASYASSTSGVMSDSNGVWLQQGNVYLSSAYRTGQWVAPVAKLMDVTQPRSYIGFRHCVATAGTLPTGVMWAIYNGAATLSSPILSGTDFPSYTLGKVYYVEILIDRVAGTRSLWIDGSLVVNGQPLTNTSTLTDPTGTINIGVAASSGSVSNNVLWQFKDMYFMDDVNTAQAVGRLGPISSNPLTVAAAVGASWVPSTGTNVSALNTAVNTSTPTTPNVADAQDGTALAVQYGSTLSATQIVKGVLLLFSGSRLAGTSTTVRTTLTDQATPTPNQLPLNQISWPTDTPYYGKQLGFLPNALDGTGWTAAKITQLTASLVASTT